MPRPLDLTSLRVGDRVQDALLVWDVTQRNYVGGTFTVLILANASGRIETAPFWDSDRTKVEGIRRRHVVQVIGEAEIYNGQPQLKVSSLRLLPEGGVDLQALLPSVGDTTPYWDTLDGWRRELKKPRLAGALSLFYDDDEFRRRYGACPASVTGHHAALGGLVKHTVEVGAIARTIGRVSGADPEVVLAGVLLHDIGKLEAYRWDGVFEYTDAGHLVGHVVLGALMLDRRLAAAPELHCTPEEQHVLHHLVLSHHGRLEYGSPVAPMTLEAEVLHWADNASAKTASMAEALHEAAAFGEALVSQRRFWQLEQRRAYRGASDWGEDHKTSSADA